jgi:DNA-binding NarL/FixJ family response regulator
VDDHVILRDGIVSILEAEPDFEVLGAAGSVAGALEAVRTHRPDLVLMDYGLPDGTGLEATREILASYPDTNVVLLTVHEEDDLLFEAVRSGAKGYLLKNISAKVMLARLRGLSQGEVAISPTQTRRILTEFARTPKPIRNGAIEQLTPREVEILRELARGASNQEIADRLYISINTVKNHVHNVLEKLGVDNRREAAKLAVERGLI